MPDLSWYAHRLAAMSPAEVAYRLRQWVRRSQDRRAVPPTPRFDPQAVLTTFRERAPALFPALSDRAAARERCNSLFPIGRVATLTMAEQVLAGEYECLGRAFQLGAIPDWHRDPNSGKAWPRLFWGEVDTRDGTTVGGVKWVWELNRHHHLVTLGKAYLLSGDERYAAAVCDQISDWIAQNPYGTGVNWTSALELSVRAINWLAALAFIAHSPLLEPARFARYVISLNEQIAYVERHRSAFSSANNHLVGELAGMGLVALLLPDLPDADRWRQIAIAELTRELPLQIYPDGVPAEQAPHYLSFVLDFNLLVWQTAERLGHTPPPVWKERLRVAGTFLAHVLDAHGHPPALGDSDDAWVLRLDDHANVAHERSLVTIAAALCADPMLRAVTVWDEQSDWLLGPASANAFAELEPAELPGSQIFRDGGYGVIRRGAMLAVVDCGPLGYLATAAHGHADALSLTLSVPEGPLLIDPGTYAYQEGRDWRRFFRSTAAHNTVQVDGADQSEMRGTFLWGRRADCRIIDWQSTAARDLLIAEHNGYEPLGITHRRTVETQGDNQLIVRDELIGSGTHQIAQFWHLPAGGAVERSEAGLHCTASGRRFRLIAQDWPQGVEVEVVEGCEQPIQGWHSPRYGELLPAPTVIVRCEASLPLTITTVIEVEGA